MWEERDQSDIKLMFARDKGSIIQFSRYQTQTLPQGSSI